MPSIAVQEAAKRRKELMSAYSSGDTKTVNSINAQNQATRDSNAKKYGGVTDTINTPVKQPVNPVTPSPKTPSVNTQQPPSVPAVQQPPATPVVQNTPSPTQTDGTDTQVSPGSITPPTDPTLPGTDIVPANTDVPDALQNSEEFKIQQALNEPIFDVLDNQKKMEGQKLVDMQKMLDQQKVEDNFMIQDQISSIQQDSDSNLALITEQKNAEAQIMDEERKSRQANILQEKQDAELEYDRLLQEKQEQVLDSEKKTRTALGMTGGFGSVARIDQMQKTVNEGNKMVTNLQIAKGKLSKDFAFKADEIEKDYSKGMRDVFFNYDKNIISLKKDVRDNIMDVKKQALLTKRQRDEKYLEIKTNFFDKVVEIEGSTATLMMNINKETYASIIDAQKAELEQKQKKEEQSWDRAFKLIDKYGGENGAPLAEQLLGLEEGTLPRSQTLDEVKQQLDYLKFQSSNYFEQARLNLDADKLNLETDKFNFDADQKNAENGPISWGGNSGGAFVPNLSLEGLKTTFTNGKLNVSIPKGTRLQCGEFVNRLWGLSSGGKDGLPSEYSGKVGLVDRRGVKVDSPNFDPNKIVPGMAFVLPIPGKFSVYGHTGIVGSKIDSKGNFVTREFNADGKEHYSERTRNINQIYGFVPPPQGKAQMVSGGNNEENSNNTKVVDKPVANLSNVSVQPNLNGLSKFSTGVMGNAFANFGNKKTTTYAFGLDPSDPSTIESAYLEATGENLIKNSAQYKQIKIFAQKKDIKGMETYLQKLKDKQKKTDDLEALIDAAF